METQQNDVLTKKNKINDVNRRDFWFLLWSSLILALSKIKDVNSIWEIINIYKNYTYFLKNKYIALKKK